MVQMVPEPTGMQIIEENCKENCCEECSLRSQTLP
jgi:hypothetical protein